MEQVLSLHPSPNGRPLMRLLRLEDALRQRFILIRDFNKIMARRSKRSNGKNVLTIAFKYVVQERFLVVTTISA